MDVAIIGCEKNRRDELETGIRACLGRDAPVKLTQYEMDRRWALSGRPETPAAVFIIIDGPPTLIEAEKASKWGEDYPVVMAATHPQYALEGIRQKVRHYILFPLEQEEIEEALKRSGVKP